MENNLKLNIKVRLIGEKEVEIQFVRIHPIIVKYEMSVFMMDRETDYMFQKSDNECKFTSWVYIMPKEVTDKNPGKCRYKFNSETERYNTMKRFSKAIMNFATGFHFKNRDNSNSRILYFNDNWFVY